MCIRDRVYTVCRVDLYAEGLYIGLFRTRKSLQFRVVRIYRACIRREDIHCILYRGDSYSQIYTWQACSSHHQVVIWICFWFSICKTQPKYEQIIKFTLSSNCNSIYRELFHALTSYIHFIIHMDSIRMITFYKLWQAQTFAVNVTNITIYWLCLLYTSDAADE